MCNKPTESFEDKQVKLEIKATSTSNLETKCLNQSIKELEKNKRFQMRQSTTIGGLAKV